MTSLVQGLQNRDIEMSDAVREFFRNHATGMARQAERGLAAFAANGNVADLGPLLTPPRKC